MEGDLTKTADVLPYGRMKVTAAALRDISGLLTLTWYNMPYLKSALRSGERFVFRGRVVKKKGRMAMEQPLMYTPEEYGGLVNSMQPVYGQTKGLGNKTIAKAVSEALKGRRTEREYLPEDIRRRCGLAGYNFALEHIHFPGDGAELLDRKSVV